MFTRGVAGRAEEAIDFYSAAFKDSKRGATVRYPRGMEPELAHQPASRAPVGEEALASLPSWHSARGRQSGFLSCYEVTPKATARCSAAARISGSISTGPPMALAVIAARAASSTIPPTRTACSGVRWKTRTP